MGTTDTRHALALLRALDALGLRYMLLHRAGDVAQGRPISDVDLVVSRPAARVIAEVASQSDQHGFRLVMAAEYDHGCVASFWMTRDGDAGVQLDFMHDPSGQNSLGVFTNAMLESQSDDNNWPPAVGEMPRHAYLLSKRIAKADFDRAVTHANAITASGERLEVALRRYLTRRRCRTVLRTLRRGRVPRSAAARHRLRQRFSLRGLRRLLRPVGIVVVAGPMDEGVGAELCAQFSRVLVRAILSRHGVRGWLKAQLLIRSPALVILNASSREAPRVSETKQMLSRQICAQMASTMAGRLQRAANR